jgi:hypothetical protein
MHDARGYHRRPWHMPRLARIILGMACGFASGTMLGAASLSAALDRDTIYEGETAEVAVTVQNASSETAPSAPTVENLTIQLTSDAETRLVIVNGVSTSSRVYRYSVQPLALGEYDIPPFTLELEGSTLGTRPLRLRVLPGQNPTIGQYAFLQLKVAKQRVYVGEGVPVEIGVAYRLRGSQYREAPQLQQEGLTMGRMEQGERRTERFGGIEFVVDPFRTFVMAARLGNLKLGPATLPFQLPVRSRLGLFGGELMTVKLLSPTLDLEVLPLPTEGVPVGFAGAVGQYTMKVEVSTNLVTAGDPILVTVEISGVGPIESLQLDAHAEWEGFKTYAPETSVELRDPLGLQGTKRFAQAVIPQSPEIKALPPIRFSYFDPERQSFQTLVQEGIPITVRRGTAMVAYQGGASPGDPEAADPEVAREIVHIKTRMGTYGAIQPPLAMRPWFLGLYVAPLLVWLGSMWWRWRQSKLASDPSLRRRMRVARLVREGLVELRQAGRRNDTEKFFATVFRLLQERLGERTGMPAAAIDDLNLDEVLRGRVEDELRDEVHELFRACNVARYAPGRMNAALNSFIPRVEEVMARLEEVERR